MLGQEKPQDFELVELLIQEAGSNVGSSPSTSTQQGSDFKSFKARFQSYIDQIPSYLHSVGKEGFFPHFFLGSFSTFIDTEIAKKLNIEKVYFSFDSAKTLKVAVIKKGEIKSPEDAADKVRLFVIAESGSTKKKFSYDELDKILGNTRVARNNVVRLARDQGKLGVKLVEIAKERDGKGKMAGISVNVESNKLDNAASTTHEFKKIKKGLWSNPESDITQLSSLKEDIVKNTLKNVLEKISKTHSQYKDSLVYGKEVREAAHHGFIAGALVNFRYRYNLRVYLEQFAGRGYADIVLVPRGKDRSLNAVPIIIELKAGTGRGTTSNDALEQAKDYAKGFQPNTMRVLTISDNVLCVGLNLDSTEGSKFQTYLSPRGEREIAPPTIQALLEEASDWDGKKDTITDIKEKIKQPLERIYHTFPGTPEKGGNYFSRFLLGQLLLANEFKRVSLEKSVFLYNEYPLASSTRSGAKSTERPVTTFMLTKGNQEQNKEVFIFHIREGGKGEFSEKKIPINLPAVGKITEVCISLQEERKSDFFDVEKVNRYNSLNEYKQGKSFFGGEWKNIPYPAELKETFDKTLESQHVPQSASVAPDSSKLNKAFDNYKGLLEKIGEGILPLNLLIEKEAHFQAVLHGAFSHYSDIRLGEPQENRALVLTEFQTGRGKRIDMLVHGIKFANQASSAKEYDPVGLELKGPREGKTADALKDEANKQISDEYTKGVTYKTLTDGKEVDFIGVVFDKGASNADSLILMSKDEFASVKVVHSSIFSFSQQRCSEGRRTRSIGILCIDSFDEEKITEKEKKKLIKELFGIEAHDTKIITIDFPQVSIDSDKVSIKYKDNDGNGKELIIDNSANIQNIGSYILDKKNLEIKLKVSSDKEYAIIEEIKEQGSEYYLKIDDYRIKLDSIFRDGKEVIFDKLHQLSNDKQLLENKKYIEDIGNVQTNQDYSNIVEEIKQNLLAKGVREDTFDRFKSHFDDLGEKVFVDYINNVESSLQEKGIAFDRDKFDSAKIKGAKGGKFFSMMAIYDLLDSICDTATLERHNNDALKQVFGINGILDAMDDVRTSVSISPNSKVGKLVSKIPQPVRQTFVKIISNPVVQSITFATIAYQFGYSIKEMAQGNHHPLNYYWTASSGVKLASMSIRPISAGISFTVKSVSATTEILRGLSVAGKGLGRLAVVTMASATTEILRGLSAAGKVLGRISVFTMVPDIVFSLHQSLYSRTMEAQAVAAQIPISNIDRAKIFFSNSEKAIYEDYIRIKSYLNTVKNNAISYLNSDPNIAAVVQYVTSIEEKYSEIIKNRGKKPIRMGMIDEYIGVDEYSSYMDHWEWVCELEKGDESISFNKVDVTSNVKEDLSLLNISQTLNLKFYQLDDIGATRFKNKAKYEEFLATQEKKKVYLISEEVKYLPHITQDEYNSGLRIVSAPLGHLTQGSQCSKVINTKHTRGDNIYYPCNTDNIYRNCQETFVLSGEPFIFTNQNNTKKQTFSRGLILYISGPKTLTAAANYPAVMHVPGGSNICYIGSKNNETIFVINNSTSGTLKGGTEKENTVVMNVKANNIVADLYSGTIHYSNSNNIRLVNTYNYVSNSDNKQNITTHCETRLINVKNAEVWQNSSNCTDKDYEVRVVNKENVHHRGLKQTIFIVNEDSDNARIISDSGSTGKMKGNIDVIRVQVANITQWGVSKDTEKDSYSLDLLANDTQSIASSTTIDDFKNLVIQVNCQGITESVTIQDKSLSDTIEDIRYQKLRNSGSDTDREIIQNSEKKLKAFIQASILDQELLDTYQIAKGIADDNNFDIPISQIEVTKNHMGIPAEKVIIAGIYSDQVIVDFSYNNSDVTQKYRNNGRSYDYDNYMTLCNYYQDATVEGGEGQHQYIIKLPDTLNHEISSFPIRLNLKIKSKAVPYQNIPYNIIDFAELNVTDVDSISIQEGKRSYINECYNQSISDLTEDSLEIKDITVLGSEGTKWSLSIGLVDYFQSPEHQQIVLRMNNELYKIDSTNLRLEHVEMNPNSFRYYQPEEQGLQIYHNQPIDDNSVGLVNFRDKSILDFDTEITDGSLVLSHKNHTLAKVENWNTYQPAREMMFAFNDTMISNLKCIVSACNSKDIIEDFNKEKVTLLKEHMFDAIMRDNINEAKDLIGKIESINTESRHELTPLYVAIQAGRLDIVEILFDRKHFSVKDKDIHGCNPLHWAAQQGNLNIAKFLVDKGADIGAKDKNGRTSLRTAACNGSLDMVKFFLDKNASIEDRNNNPYKMMGVVEIVKNEIINQADTAPNVKRWAEFFVEKLRYSIKSVAKEKLKDGMLRNRYSSVNELANEIYKSDGKLFDDIIKGVINDVYGRVDTKKILSCVHNHSYISECISGYVAVFDTMQRNNDLNNDALFKLAYYIKEAIEMKNYPTVPQEKKSELENLKGRLPESVRNAVFSSKVCIKNIYQGEYLYAANKCFNYDTDRRMAFTWTPKNEKNDKFRWNIKPDGDNFYIVNVAFNETLYAASNYFNYDNDRRMVFTWISGGRVARDVWKLRPYGDNCSIMNVKLNEYLYAADYAKYDDDRRRVFTWIPGGQVLQGMWIIEDCGSNVRKARNADAGSSLDIVKVSRQAQLDHALLNVTKVGNISEVTGLVNQGANVNTEDRDGNTPARNAVLKGHFGIFKYLVENGVSLEGKDHRCGPSICDASYSGNLDILKYLISKCVDINDTDKNGWTPLHFAAWRGYLEVANFLIEKGADINAENIFGRKPIHIAAENNNKDIIDFFLSKGMSIDDTDRDGRTLLYLASWNGRLDIVKYLVDKGADVHTQDKGGKTLLDIATDQKHNNIVEYLKQVQLDKELLIAAQYGNLSKVEDLVSQGASLSAKYSDGRTLMHCAAYGGELNVVKYLVVGEKSSLKIKDNSGRIPLHYAAYNGKLDIVKYFIDEEKIDVNIKDHGGWAPLYYASCGGYSNVINYLGKIHSSDLISNLQENSTFLEIPNSNNIEVQDKLGRTLLHLAAKAGDLSKINLLCDDYNANIEAQDNFGYTPIFFATQSGKLNVVSLLLYYGANINAQDMYGSTPLHYAAQEGNLGMIQLLLSRCARIELLDRNGWTPILFAARESKWNAVELLVSKGAKFNNEITYQGTPLHFAVREGNLDTVKFLIDKGANIESQDDYNNKPLHLAVRMNRLDIVKFLLDKHANIEARDVDGDIPLELAIQSGYKDIEEVLRQAQLDLDKELLNAAKSGDLDKVKECIKRGAYINTKSSNGRTSLHWAAFEGCLPGVEYLIKEVADINAKDNTSRTPLHYATRNGHLDVVKYLIEEGADFEVKDKDNKTPLDLASWKKHNDVVKYLEKIKEERDKTVQRKRRHHHGDHARHHMSRKPLAIDLSNQSEIVASSGTRPSSWMNIVANTIVDAIKGISRFVYSPLKVELPEIPENGSDHSDTARNPSNQYTNQFSSEVYVSNNVGLAFFLLQSFLDKKYPLPKLCSATPGEALASTLNTIGEFEEILRKTAKQSGVLVKDFNFFKVYLDVAGHIRSERYSQVPNALYSATKEACPKNEKFLSILKGNIEKMLDRQQMVNSNNQEKGIANVDPSSSLNGIVVEPANNRGLKGVIALSIKVRM